MRLTQVLHRQHLGFMFKKHWRIQGKRTPTNTGAEDELVSRGLKVVDCKDLLHPKKTLREVDIVGVFPQAVPKDENHPLWHSEKCHIFGDCNVLLEGVTQAQYLLKTVEFTEFPSNVEEQLEKIKIPKIVDSSMQQSVLASHVYDSQQEKTAIIKLQERPAFNLPRNYGITDNRKNRLILSKLIQNCEKIAGRTITSSRKIINDAFFVIPFRRDDDLIQFEKTVDTFISSRKTIAPYTENITEDFELPNLFPIKHTISIPTTNIYDPRSVYPIHSSNDFSHPHTILLHYSGLDVNNLHGTPVNETQFESRSLLKSFTVAAAKAKTLYGEDVKILSKPIVVQAIQTNGQSFHFSIFQLNTLDLNGSAGVKNYWYKKTKIDLFSKCEYSNGKPVLEDYNSDVLKYCSLFYNN